MPSVALSLKSSNIQLVPLRLSVFFGSPEGRTVVRILLFALLIFGIAIGAEDCVG